MSDSFSVDVTQLQHFAEQALTVPDILHRELLNAANAVGFSGESIAKQSVAVARGTTRASIAKQPAVSIADGVSVSIVAGGAGIYLENGRRPGAPMPPQGALLDWMALKGIDPKSEFAIRRAIGLHGTKAQPFMAPTLKKLSGGIAEQLFDAAIERALKAIGGVE